MAQTIGDIVEWWGRIQPDTIALCFDKTDTVTFRELEAWTGRVAEDLLKQGLNLGDRVGLFGTNAMEWAIGAIAAMRAGAVMVPLNYRYTAHEVATVIGDCTPSFVFTDEARSGRIGELPGCSPVMLPFSRISQLRTGEPAVLHLPVIDPDATIVVTYTSGSTAKPKGVMFTHRSTCGYAFEAMLNYPVYRVGAKAYNVPPLYTGGGTVQLIQFLIIGMTHFFESEFRAERALDLLIEEGIEVFTGVPTFFERIAATPRFAEADLSHIKLAAIGGARVSLSLLKTWLGKRVVLRQLYGLTEGGGTTSTMSESGAVAHPEKCGRGGVFTKHRVVLEDGTDAPPDTPGEILVNGPGMMKGYWNAPEATASTMVDGWLRTGDIGTLDQQGNITVVDRLKDIIISGGLNICPVDIESVIAELGEIDEVAVIGAKDERFGETPMAILHCREPIEIAKIIGFCNDRLADYKVPRYLAFEVEPLPRLASGKIAKRILKERYANASDMLERVR